MFIAHFGIKTFNFFVFIFFDLNHLKVPGVWIFLFGGLLSFVSFPNKREGSLTDSEFCYSLGHLRQKFFLGIGFC